MHAGSGRVGDDDVGTAVAPYEVRGEDVLHVSCEELGVVNAVELGVYLCVLDGFRNVFYAYDLLGGACDEVRNGACSRVQVID